MSMIILNDNINVYELYIAHFENDRENARINEKKKKKRHNASSAGVWIMLSLCLSRSDSEP